MLSDNRYASRETYFADHVEPLFCSDWSFQPLRRIPEFCLVAWPLAVSAVPLQRTFPSSGTIIVCFLLQNFYTASLWDFGFQRPCIIHLPQQHQSRSFTWSQHPLAVPYLKNPTRLGIPLSDRTSVTTLSTRRAHYVEDLALQSPPVVATSATSFVSC